MINKEINKPMKIVRDKETIKGLYIPKNSFYNKLLNENSYIYGVASFDTRKELKLYPIFSKNELSRTIIYRQERLKIEEGFKLLPLKVDIRNYKLNLNDSVTLYSNNNMFKVTLVKKGKMNDHTYKIDTNGYLFKDYTEKYVGCTFFIREINIFTNQFIEDCNFGYKITKD